MWYIYTCIKMYLLYTQMVVWSGCRISTNTCVCVTYCWHDSFLFVPWCVICETCFIHKWHMTHVYAWHHSFIVVTWLMCDMNRWHMQRGSFMCKMNPSYVWCDSFLCVPWCVIRDMVYSLNGTPLICTCGSSHSYVWHDISFMCDMTYVWHVPGTGRVAKSLD